MRIKRKINYYITSNCFYIFLKGKIWLAKIEDKLEQMHMGWVLELIAQNNPETGKSSQIACWGVNGYSPRETIQFFIYEECYYSGLDLKRFRKGCFLYRLQVLWWPARHKVFPIEFVRCGNWKELHFYRASYSL